MEDDVIPEGEEPRRVLGFPLPAHRVVREGEEPRRVLGFPVPLGLLEAPNFHFRRVVHPARWVRWRLQVRRLGPYAPNYDDFRSSIPEP